jgi:hypothetical protein
MVQPRPPVQFTGQLRLPGQTVLVGRGGVGRLTTGQHASVATSPIYRACSSEVLLAALSHET